MCDFFKKIINILIYMYEICACKSPLHKICCHQKRCSLHSLIIIIVDFFLVMFDYLLYLKNYYIFCYNLFYYH
jgi:hypothetical protein